MNRLLLCLLLAAAAGLAEARDLRWVRSFTYVLQDPPIATLGASDFDLVIMDYSSNGEESGEFTPQQIETVRAGEKVVLAYISVGEAENYRYYWQPEWTPGNPEWLGPENPDWAGNFRVHYWDPEWQAIILDYLDRIIDQGFDGIYMDIIDGYEFWEPRGRPSARQDMVDWVSTLAHHARVDRGLSEFYVIAQNGEELADLTQPYAAEFTSTIDGIGREDTFYNDNTRQPIEERLWVSNFLDQVLGTGGLVMTVDYCSGAGRIDEVYSGSLARGWVPYVTTRPLDQMVINAGHEPPAGPPPTTAWRWLLPQALTTKRGTTLGNLAAVLGRDSEGVTYGETLLLSPEYAGIFSFALPADLPPEQILELRMVVNYMGPGAAEEKWYYALRDFATPRWAVVGSNAGVTPWHFTELDLGAPQPPQQFEQGGTLWAGTATAGTQEVCELDFVGLKLHYQR